MSIKLTNDVMPTISEEMVRDGKIEEKTIEKYTINNEKIMDIYECYSDNNDINKDIKKNVIETDKNDEDEDEVNVLSGDNKVDVDIEPDVKANDVYLQLCSCSFVVNCLTWNSVAKNSD